MDSEIVNVYVEICRDGVRLPSYARPGDAGMDVRAAVDIDVAPGSTAIVPTGLKLAIPEGFEVQVRPRSGLSFKTPIRVANAPGTIDSGYRDEVGIIVWNSSPSEVVHISAGDRIAQLVLARVPRILFTEVEDVSIIGQDRGGGFGHTGRR